MFMNTKKGFSLIELMLVLGIAACISISSFIIYPKVQASAKEQRENDDYSSFISQDIIKIQASIQNMMKDKTSYSDLKYINTKDLTTNYQNVDITSSNKGPAGTNGSSFDIKYKGLTGKECQTVITNVSSNFYIVSVNDIKLSNRDLCNREENTLTLTSL
ncbi:type II secretion system protein [Shigella flexneri]